MIIRHCVFSLFRRKSRFYEVFQYLVKMECFPLTDAFIWAFSESSFRRHGAHNSFWNHSKYYHIPACVCVCVCLYFANLVLQGNVCVQHGVTGGRRREEFHEPSCLLPIYNYDNNYWFLWLCVCVCVCVCVYWSLSHVRLFATPCTVAHQVPLSMEFSRQEHWTGLPFPSPKDLPYPGVEPGLPHCRQIFTAWTTRDAPL